MCTGRRELELSAAHLFRLSVDHDNALTCDVNVIDIDDTHTRTEVKREHRRVYAYLFDARDSNAVSRRSSTDGQRVSRHRVRASRATRRPRARIDRMV